MNLLSPAFLKLNSHFTVILSFFNLHSALFKSCTLKQELLLNLLHKSQEAFKGMYVSLLANRVEGKDAQNMN